jgi:hypothetical protein
VPRGQRDAFLRPYLGFLDGLLVVVVVTTGSSSKYVLRKIRVIIESYLRLKALELFGQFTI